MNFNFNYLKLYIKMLMCIGFNKKKFFISCYDSINEWSEVFHLAIELGSLPIFMVHSMLKSQAKFDWLRYKDNRMLSVLIQYNICFATLLIKIKNVSLCLQNLYDIWSQLIWCLHHGRLKTYIDNQQIALSISFFFLNRFLILTWYNNI